MIDDNENISELKLLESLDLGHRKIYNEELKQKENEDFVGDINLLLSRLNERIDALKNIPKLEIKTFDIESVNSNIDTNNNNNNNNIKNNNIKNNLNSINKPESQINNLSNNNINNNKKQIFFNKLNLNIKLGEEDITKEIVIDIENDDISEIVNDIIKKYNLNENYFEPLLNIIGKTMNILINFDKMKITQKAIKNLEKNKKILDEDTNDIDNSLILDLIENNNYKSYFTNMLPDIYDRKINKKRNLSCSYIHRKKL